MKKIECVRFFRNKDKFRIFQAHYEDEAIGLDEDEGIGTELNSPTDTVDIKIDEEFIYHEEANLEVMVSYKIACSQHVFMFFNVQVDKLVQEVISLSLIKVMQENSEFVTKQN